MSYDLILRGGRLIDPSQRLDLVTDIASATGKVACIGPGLNADGATEVRDLTGAIVTPGLIDLHTHVYRGGTFPIDQLKFYFLWTNTTGYDALVNVKSYVALNGGCRVHAVSNFSTSYLGGGSL